VHLAAVENFVPPMSNTAVDDSAVVDAEGTTGLCLFCWCRRMLIAAYPN
jgi:hypothetical protein